MRIIYAIATFSIGLMVLSAANAMESGVGNNTKGCQECHNGIESIRDQNSEMMQEIFIQGQKLGDPVGCIVCHGGDLHATTKKDAHKGKAFYPDPGSPWINKFTCGQCHTELVKAPQFPLSTIYRFRNNSIKRPLLPIRQKMAESALRSAGDKMLAICPRLVYRNEV